MNKTELINRLSEDTNVTAENCEKILYALEKIFNERLEASNGIANAFDKIYKLISLFRNK